MDIGLMEATDGRPLQQDVVERSWGKGASGWLGASTSVGSLEFWASQASRESPANSRAALRFAVGRTLSDRLATTKHFVCTNRQ